MRALKNKYEHRKGILSLYRSLLRNIAKINDTNLDRKVTIRDEYSFSMLQEIKKYEANPELYIRYLKSEIRRGVELGFRPQKIAELNNANVIRDKLMEGVNLDEGMETFITQNRGGESLCRLILFILNYRKEKMLEQTWRADYLKNPTTIDSIKKSQMPPLFAKQLNTWMKEKPILSYSNLGLLRDKRKRIRDELEQSRLNSLSLLQRYCMQQQRKHLLPMPQLLPYTGIKIGIRDIPFVKEKHLKEAYDWDYIEGIIKPGLAYDINKYHYLDTFQNIIQKKGPYKVRVKTTEAGPMLIPYLELPYPRLEELKEVALDIKKLTKLYRLKVCWNISAQSESSITEPRHRDGSISVKGSKGFGIDERIYPLSHYESWAKYEAQWEYLIDKESSKPSSISSYLESWRAPLKIASDSIDSELNSYFIRHRDLLKNSRSKIYEEQELFQNRMDKYYDKLLISYKSLIEDLQNHHVFKHGEIVDNGINRGQSFERMVIEEDKKHRSKRNCIPERETFGLKMQLGDYLKKNSRENFQWGQKFDKKFRF